MRRSTIEKLCCPACRRPYLRGGVDGGEDSIETCFLTCPECCVTIPVLNGFPLFEIQKLAEQWDAQPDQEMLFGSEPEYLAFLDQKKVKPVFDLYAAFQPFNESTQSIFPLIPLLREVVQPGDFLLDLWCRTGWSGELLAALFPDQFVISVWESSAGVLGTRGFHHWLGTGKRRKNLDIIFHSPNQPLPFPDNMFSVVHGLDTLHRYHHVPLLSECLRVVKENGMVVFPHNHLTNSEPDPYFDRGEDQLHGLEYRQYFHRLLKNSHRKAYILSEKTLFDAGPEYVLKDEADTMHYNACILLADSKYEGRSIRRPAKNLEEYRDGYVTVNPLWQIDLTGGPAMPADDAMDRGGAELFFRHPIYLDRLNKHSPVSFTEQERLILYWAQRNKSVSEIASLVLPGAGSGPACIADIFERLLNLESKEVLQLQNVSGAMARLQAFYSTQMVSPEEGSATLKHLWQRTVRMHPERPFILWPQDDSIFSYKDSDTIVRKAVSFLKSEGVTEGDRIVVQAIHHPEFMFVFWASVLLGAVMIPVNSEMKPDAVRTVLKNTQPRLAFLSFSGAEREPVPVIPFGLSEDSPDFDRSFSARLSDYEACVDLPDAREQQPAAILFTSGSTGLPKGIFLSHGALYRTSRILDQVYKWRSEDRFLGAGSFHTMSGLRNPCIAVLHSGASVVLPSTEDLQNPLGILGMCVKNDVTILNVTPGFLAFWGRTGTKSKYFDAHKLRMVLSTGSALQPVHRQIFRDQFRVPIYDYYGLTETTGACILETPEMDGFAEKGIGIPRDCIVKICDDGELAIYSENLMLGYLNDPQSTARRIRNGWLMTGDIARINDAGCVVLVGRKDRMMKDKNGELVSPEEIENVISSIDPVSEVYVTTYQDDLLIDQIAALIQFRTPEEGTEKLLWKIRAELEQRLPVPRIPAVLLAVSQMPKSSSGKISREGAQKLIAQELRSRR